MKKHESSVLTLSDNFSLQARKDIFQLMNTYPSTDEEKERSLGLFLRGSLLARLFAIRELYELIVDKPGAIFDVGTWRGQTAVLCENLRAIFEPLHLNRRIVAFDTFEGYVGFTEKDAKSELHKNGTYKVEEGYDEYLANLLELHEQSNVMGHNFGKHKVIKGDCTQTIPDFLNKHKEEYLALSFFDINAVEPTLKVFDEIYQRTIPSGVIAFWQMSRGESITGEGYVYANEILSKYEHTVHRSKFYPSLCYIIKK